MNRIICWIFGHKSEYIDTYGRLCKRCGARGEVTYWMNEWTPNYKKEILWEKEEDNE